MEGSVAIVVIGKVFPMEIVLFTSDINIFLLIPSVNQTQCKQMLVYILCLCVLVNCPLN